VPQALFFAREPARAQVSPDRLRIFDGLVELDIILTRIAPTPPPPPPTHTLIFNQIIARSAGGKGCVLFSGVVGVGFFFFCKTKHPKKKTHHNNKPKVCGVHLTGFLSACRMAGGGGWGGVWGGVAATIPFSKVSERSFELLLLMCVLRT